MAPIVAVVAWKTLPANLPLVRGLSGLGLASELMNPHDAADRLRPGDVALVRLDVSRELDGVEPGMASIRRLRERGVRVLNDEAAVLAAHDKLVTAHRLRQAGVPHPRTLLVSRPRDILALGPPLVLKPRFGSWGHDVMRCRDAGEIRRNLEALAGRSWFRRHGALAQELIPPPGYDLRLVVAGGDVVGAIVRHAAPGEWRTNFSLGGQQSPVQPPPAACALACRAARAIGADLLGLDLLPLPDGGHVVLEANAAADFDSAESLPGRNVYRDLAAALGLLEPRSEVEETHERIRHHRASPERGHRRDARAAAR